MASRLLKSGQLDNYQAIGEDGVLVWQKAEAFLASIQSSDSLGKKYAEYLALPRFSPDGNQVDWFIPFSADNTNGDYDVVSWNATSLDEKKKALEELEELNEKFLNHGYNLQARALTTNDKIFAHFLTGNNVNKAVNPAIHFPDENCIFIVNGRPVITFWGFLNKGDTVTETPFTRLRQSVNTIAPAAVATAATATEAVVATRSHKWCWLLLLLLLLLLPFLLYLLWWYFFARGLPLFKTYPDLGNFSLDPNVKFDLPIPDITGPDLGFSLPGVDLTLPNVNLDGNTTLVDPALKTDGVVPVDGTVPVADDSQLVDPNTNLPVDDANANVPAEDLNSKTNDDETKVDDNKATDETSPNTVPPELNDKEGPELSNEDLKSGDISKLDGKWNVNSPLVERQTNQPIDLQYEFKNGEGTATVTYRNGTKCTGSVNGKLASGALNISSESIAKCSDGSDFVLPEVKCTTGKNGNSDCNSVYSGKKSDWKSSFNMSLHR